jgi:type II secretory ATPase GspE/PulE/Tfp pilus assembly ATPase PilB-like protein
MAICELLDLTDRIREMIPRQAAHLGNQARGARAGHALPARVAVERVMTALTTLREINKVTFVE